MTVIMEVNADDEDDMPIEDAVRWSLTGAGCGAIDEALGEQIVSINVVPLGQQHLPAEESDHG